MVTANDQVLIQKTHKIQVQHIDKYVHIIMYNFMIIYTHT